MNFLISFSGHSEVCVAQKRIFRFLEKPCTRVVTHASEIPFQFSLYLSKDNLLPKNLFKSINITVFLFYSPYITLQNSFSVKYTHNRLKWCEIWFKTTMCEVQAHAYFLFEWRMMEIAPLRIYGTGRVLRSLREVIHLMLRLAGAVTRTCLVYQLVFAVIQRYLSCKMPPLFSAFT